jgi:glycosyltransferase involved in cell wall biosynthesis
MVKRKRVGLFFSYNENWIGGTYYILNLIEALKLLPLDKQPALSVIVIKHEDKKKVEPLNYPFIEFSEVKLNEPILKRAIRFLARTLLKKDILKPTLKENYPEHYFDAIFPAPLVFDTRLTKKIIYWIADFQDVYLPSFFPKKELAFRKATHQKIAKSLDTVIFSSYDALSDFEKFYPERKVTSRVLQFAVTHPDYMCVDIRNLKIKYGLPESYFFCPNQFWVHKNQQIILQAVTKLKYQYNKNIKVVFSGKAYDQRNEQYFESLQQIIDDNGIEENIFILGFIDRREQLQIMKHAFGVIQPSLFEGWSTVVEDVKAMNQNVIVSDLRVHREQLGEKAFYFDPTDSSSLVEAILNFERMPVDFAYNTSRINFANNFLKIIDE